MDNKPSRVRFTNNRDPVLLSAYSLPLKHLLFINFLLAVPFATHASPDYALYIGLIATLVSAMFVSVVSHRNISGRIRAGACMAIGMAIYTICMTSLVQMITGPTSFETLALPASLFFGSGAMTGLILTLFSLS